MQQTTPLTLEHVKHQFDDWRAQKHPSDKIPDKLWCLVRELIDDYHYKRTPVGRTLGISSEQLNRKLGPNPHKTNNKPCVKKQFVQAPVSTLTAATMPSASSPIIINKPDGMTLSFTQLSNEQFSQLLNHFIGG